MHFLYIFFYACMRLRFLDVEKNPGRCLMWRLILILLSAEYSVVMCWAWPGSIKQTVHPRRGGRVGETGGLAHSDGVAICRSSNA